MKPFDQINRGPELTESLAVVIDLLGDGPPGPTLLGSADHFLTQLSDHIAEEEDLVFPALDRVSAEKTPQFKALKAEHVTLLSSARDLVGRILKGDLVVDTARVLLVQLLEHIRSENGITSRTLDLLGVGTRRRLAFVVSTRRVRNEGPHYAG